MEQEVYLTPEGAEKLKTELEELKGPKRDEIAKRLRSAIQMGDLSENADYHKAKEDQGFMEGRIQELEYLLRNAKIIDVSDKPAETYFLVGATEADPRNGRISNESPIGRVLLGGRVGDEVTASTPGGEIKLKILKIE